MCGRLSSKHGWNLPEAPAPAGWHERLARGKAQIAAGRASRCSRFWIGCGCRPSAWRPRRGNGGGREGHCGPLIALSPEASVQVDALKRFAVEKGRPQELQKPGHALVATSLIVANPLSAGCRRCGPTRP